MAALENVALWHERDISHSSVERVILPDSFIALDHMLRRFTRIVAGLVVYPDRMRENLERSRGVIFSGQVLLELARRGVSREQAYEWVQRNAMRSFHDQKDFKSLLLSDPDVRKVLNEPEIEKAFDLSEQLRNVDAHPRSGFRGESLDRPGAMIAHRSRNASARVRHLEAVGVRSAGTGGCRCPHLSRVQRREGREAREVFRSRARRQ